MLYYLPKALHIVTVELGEGICGPDVRWLLKGFMACKTVRPHRNACYGY